MPASLNEIATAPRVLVAAEGISVKQSVSLFRIPRASVTTGTKLLVGAVVLCPDRVLASVGRDPILDTDFGDTARDAPMLTLAEDGIRITFNVAQMLDGGSGSIEVHYRLALDSAALAQLPSRSCPVTLTNVANALLNGWKGQKAR
jgi:hypothetical protein